MKEKYTISYRYEGKIITPKQKNTSYSSEVNFEDIFNAMLENDISPEAKLEEVIIFRPNISVEYLSAQEILFMKEVEVPFTIKNNKEEKTFN